MKEPVDLLLAMGYLDDGWLSTIVHAEQLHQALGDAVSGPLFAPRLGHPPRLWERRLSYGLSLPAAKVLHLLDPAYADALLLARKRCDHLAVTVTDLAFWLQRTRLNSWFRQRIVTGLRAADGLIAISRQTAAEMQDHLGLVATQVIYLGTDPAVFRASSLERSPYQLLHVGSTIERKGIDRLLRLLAHLPAPYHLLQIGGIFTAEQRSLIAAFGLEPRIVQRKASLQDLVHAYQSSAALVFPSRYEGYGLPCIEARLCGTPVLTSAVVPALEVLAQDPGTQVLAVELLDASAREAYPEAALHRLKDELVHSLLPRLGQQVELAGRSWYSWQRAAAEHRAFYQSLGASDQLRPRRGEAA